MDFHGFQVSEVSPLVSPCADGELPWRYLYLIPASIFIHLGVRGRRFRNLCHYLWMESCCERNLCSIPAGSCSSAHRFTNIGDWLAGWLMGLMAPGRMSWRIDWATPHTLEPTRGARRIKDIGPSLQTAEPGIWSLFLVYSQAVPGSYRKCSRSIFVESLVLVSNNFNFREDREVHIDTKDFRYHLTLPKRRSISTQPIVIKYSPFCFDSL